MDILTAFISTNLESQNLTLLSFRARCEPKYYAVTALVKEIDDPVQFLILRKTLEKNS